MKNWCPWWLAIIAAGLVIGQWLGLARSRDIFVLFWALFWIAFGLTLQLSEPAEKQIIQQFAEQQNADHHTW